MDTTTQPVEHSRSVEDFLKAVYTVQQAQQAVDETSEGRASTNALAEILAISPPSVTDMARRMVNAGLVDYRKYRGVRLTEEGRTVALRMIRRHRLIELYLVEELGYELHEVHHEAESLEHAVSDRFVQAIAQKLGNPTVDPHGDPIPSVDGRVLARDLIPLTELAPGNRAQVSRFVAENDAMLQHILERNFHLGSWVEMVNQDPFEGPVTALVENEEQVIGYQVARCILVDLPSSRKVDT
ncbi:MAG: metal-dependent transcriptional regulator [Chloroflexota bacterium]